MSAPRLALLSAVALILSGCEQGRDAKTGDLLTNIDASVPNANLPNKLWMIDSKRQRLLAYKPSERASICSIYGRAA